MHKLTLPYSEDFRKRYHAKLKKCFSYAVYLTECTTEELHLIGYRGMSPYEAAGRYLEQANKDLKTMLKAYEEANRP